MNTATINPIKKTFERSPQEERAINLSINNGKPLVEVLGTNTFPLVGLFRVFGGTFNKETKNWSVPDHKWHEAQSAADAQTAKQAERVIAKGQPKTVAAPVSKPVAAPVVEKVAAPVATATADRIVFRTANLLAAATDLHKAATNEKVKTALALAIDALTLAGQEAITAV